MRFQLIRVRWLRRSSASCQSRVTWVRQAATGSDRRTVAWHGVVGAVPPHHACQPPSLLGEGLIPASLELVFDLSELGPHPLGDRDLEIVIRRTQNRPSRRFPQICVKYA